MYYLLFSQKIHDRILTLEKRKRSSKKKKEKKKKSKRKDKLEHI